MRGPVERVRFFFDHRWSPDHMSEYLDGDLDAGGRRRIERHTGKCPECEELLRELRAMVAALAGFRGRAAEGVAAAVLAGVQQRLAREGADDRPL
jgi:anti-sigma factor RsiW